MLLPIIFENSDLIAINKPHGLLVHKTMMAGDASEFAIQSLRDQVGYHVYPVHRIDRKTSGVLLFAKSRQVCAEVQPLFDQRQVKKMYLAIVRGFIDASGEIRRPLLCGHKKKDAITRFECKRHYELPFPSHHFSTSRYSLVELTPSTGRFHQLRRHLAHINHPIIGDRPHGCNKQNRLWLQKFGMSRMLLHARELQLVHRGDTIQITAPVSEVFRQAKEILNSGDKIST